MITAEVICDSISPKDHRLTTFKLCYPKFIHSEFMTHRVISRNASSSRAIPVAKLIAEVRGPNFAGPVYWGAEQKGMQSGEELDNTNPFYVSSSGGYITARALAQEFWGRSANDAANRAEIMAKLGVHKSIVNRVLEPYSHIHVVATATEWDNFFGLRLDRAAQPEMRVLAIAMFEARKASTPKLLRPGDWHLPFVDPDKEFGIFSGWLLHQDTIGLSSQELFIRVSVARCARVSYESFETGKRSTVEEDLKLYERLVGAQPLHASPAEHQATPDIYQSLVGEGWEYEEEHGNFVGWRQYRKMLPNEAVAPLPEEYR